MKKRILINEIEPAAYKAMLVLEDYGRNSGVNERLKELVKIRASQINKCAYCIDMHTEDALKIGESERRIFALSAWQESHLFSEEERAALQLAEEVTLISQHGVADNTYGSCINIFGEKITAALIMLIVTINAWNRIAVSTKVVYK
jgi:AhpD family alkylhydroperoxidase